MKKYLYISILMVFVLGGCVKDENPAPTPPPPPEPEQYADIVINELMAKDAADPYFVDASGNGADWVELYNKGAEAVNIAGMFITDKEGEEAEYQQIHATDAAITSIPPKGFLVLICGAADANGADLPTQILDGHIFVDMGISASKDSIIALFDPSLNLISRSANFGPDGALGGLPDDKSAGPDVDGSNAGAWLVLANKTPGKPNDGAPLVEGELIVNEFMCSNDVVPVPGVEGDFPDYIEIYNTGDIPIDMAGWYVSDDLLEVTQYQFPLDQPELTIVPPHGFLLIICDGIGEGLHAACKLSSGGESFGISKDGVSFIQEITYGDGEAIPAPPTNSSAGLDVDGGANWMQFDPETDRPPTPGASNN